MADILLDITEIPPDLLEFFEPVEPAFARDVLRISTAPYSGAHFATFPPALVEPCILAGSRPGDIVLDPFSGTATVGMVAIKYQRQYIGVELKPEYIELAKKRVSSVQISLLR